MSKIDNAFRRNELARHIRPTHRSGSRMNYFKYHQQNSDAHEDTKFQVFKKLIRLGFDVWTEVPFVNGGRADIVAVRDGKGYIVEILHSEKEEKILEKQDKYPFEFELIKVRTKDDITKFEL